MQERITARKIKLGIKKEPKPPRKPKAYQAVHRTIMENDLGRKMYADEVVHHVDNDHTNNCPTNLLNFACTSDHTRFHKVARQFGSLMTLKDRLEYIRNNT